MLKRGRMKQPEEKKTMSVKVELSADELQGRCEIFTRVGKNVTGATEENVYK